MKHKKVAALLLIAAGLLVALFAYWQTGIIKNEAKQQAAQQVEQQARAFARDLADELTALEQYLRKFVLTEDRLALFTKGEGESSVANQLSTRLNAFNWVRIFPSSYNADQIVDEPGLGYAYLDMVNSLKRGEKPPFEVHQLRGKQQLVLVRPIPPTLSGQAQTKAVAYLVLNLDSQWIRDKAKMLPFKQGYLEIIQKGLDRALFSEGNPSFRVGQPVEHSINGSRWSVHYWPPTQELGLSALMLPLVAYAVSIVLLLAGLYLIARELLASRKTNTEKPPQPELGEDSVLQQTTDSLASSSENMLTNVLFDEGIQLDDVDDEFINKRGVPDTIVHKYDFRGLVGEQLTDQVMGCLGVGIACLAKNREQKKIFIAYDGRLSSPGFAQSMIKGLSSMGLQVVNLGMVPTPLLYFAALDDGCGNGVMITGSHNPASYNGVKVMLAGETLYGDDLKQIHQLSNSDNRGSAQGNVEKLEILPSYQKKLSEQIIIARALKVVIDTGNGAAGPVVRQLYEALGCDVIQINEEVDGNFPNHHPNPSDPKNLEELQEKVVFERADIGLAFDGDGDRLGVVSSTGQIVWPDQVLMLLAKDLLSRLPGSTVLYDVKSSGQVADFVTQHGGQAVMCESGHSLVKAKLKQMQASLAGEMSGHLYLKEKWYGVDDALFAAARLLEVLATDTRESQAIFDELPKAMSTPEIYVDVTPQQANKVMQQLLANKPSFSHKEIITLDGLRINFDDGWGLVRASNTTPSLVFRFEGENEDALKRITSQFKQMVQAVDPSIEMPF